MTVFDESGSRQILPEQLLVESVGCKALGLSMLPSGWYPPYIVIDESVSRSTTSSQSLQSSLNEVLRAAGLGGNVGVLVRSSGTAETLEQSGEFESRRCLGTDVIETIRQLANSFPKDKSGKVHWVVQRFVDSIEKGHLSNERHLKREPRDWLVEFEVRLGAARTAVPLAVRKWRDGTILELDLSCPLTFDIHRRLKRVAMWAMQSNSRMHFEWVWDGSRLFIVQAQGESHNEGKRPHSILPKTLPSTTEPDLKVFRSASAVDFQNHGKLRNALLYQSLGYSMPNFFVLDDIKLIAKLLEGKITDELKADLDALTQRPLIIRTDGKDIPRSKREMLPRSEGLYDAGAAIEWIRGKFRFQLEENDLLDCSISLIAHSFIPSVASAWARATPGNRYVRIESLWGIPEGLYWYSHDTFIVDTLTSDLHRVSDVSTLDYRAFEHLRYKGNFIAPDSEGNWLSFQPTRPHQWGRSIQKDRWLFEIANTTRLVAEKEGIATAVMWFVDNHPNATSHQVLPWYHSESELGPAKAAAPRHKYRGAADVDLRTPADWDNLKLTLEQRRIERVIVSPTDPELIRNPKFARDLGELSKEKEFVVELSGGLLSHAYYMLKKSGAKVECADLFEGDVESIEYNKLVRDRIPDLILEHGEEVETYELAGDALVAALRQKLVEEAYEVLDLTSGSDLLSELVDVEEVLDAIYEVLDLSRQEVKAERAAKVKKRGAFKRGILLRKTVSAQSTDTQPDIAVESPNLEFENTLPPVVVISDITDLPTGRIYRRPDLRRIEHQSEKILTVEFDANVNVNLKQELSFKMPINGVSQEFTLGIEFTRSRARMRGIIRLKTEPLQLRLDFGEIEDSDE